MAVLLREMARMLTVVLSLNRNSEGGHACAFLFGWLENSHGCKMLPLRGADAIQRKKIAVHVMMCWSVVSHLKILEYSECKYRNNF